MIRLCVTSASGRQRFETDRTEVLLGSRDGADLRIEGEGVAANHCLLKIQGGVLVLVDLGSATGIQFAGATVRQATIPIGGAFRVGDVLVEVERFDGATSAAPPATAAVVAQQLVAAAPVAPAAGTPVRSTSGPARPTGAAPIPKAAESDFGAEVRKRLSATPWYGISLVVHAIVVLIFALIPYETRHISESRTMQATLTDQRDEIDVAPAELTPAELEDEPAPADEDDFEDLIEETEKPKSQEQSDIVIVEREPVAIGFGQQKLNKRIRPLRQAKRVGEPDGETAVNRSRPVDEQKRASGVVSKGIGRGLGRLRAINRREVVVVEGEFDHMQEILDLYRIPHTTIRRSELTSFNLKRVKVLCVNCGRTPRPALSGVLVKKVQSFVKNGGWLIASDWALAPYIVDGFPKYVKEHKPRAAQRDTTIEVRARSKTSPLLEGVFARRMTTRWWLEEASKFVKPRSSKVNVLVDSPDMEERWGTDAVAIEFRPSRKGRVVYSMGHFFQKDGNRIGVEGMHRLILNFLLERFRAQ